MSLNYVGGLDARHVPAMWRWRSTPHTSASQPSMDHLVLQSLLFTLPLHDARKQLPLVKSLCLPLYVQLWGVTNRTRAALMHHVNQNGTVLTLNG